MDALLTMKYNQNYFNAFCLANGISNLEEALKKTEAYYNKCLAIRQQPTLEVEKTVEPVLKNQRSRPAKNPTYAQVQARQSIRDRMQTAKKDMIEHIQNAIGNGLYSIAEFIADPTVYFDSQVMGKYYKNYFIRQAIIGYFKKDFVPF